MRSRRAAAGVMQDEGLEEGMEDGVLGRSQDSEEEGGADMSQDEDEDNNI